MNVEDFNDLISSELQAIVELQRKKGIEYAESADRLSNFKIEAAQFGVKPMTVLGIYMNKHITLVRKAMKAIEDGTFDKLQANMSEPIEGRFRDIIVYSLIAIAMLEEMNSAPTPVHPLQEGANHVPSRT